MSVEKSANIFVSHYHSDSKYIKDIVRILKKHDTEMRDSSIYEEKAKNDAKNPDYIRSLLSPHITWAGTVIVLIGPKTSSSDWVNWEVEYAAKHDKNIVGVFLKGATDADVPKAIMEKGTSLIAWNPDKIAQAVNGDEIWENPDGTPRETPIFEVTRSTC